jgi:uncharacterized membrane protein YhaH (DUF805 family)
MQGEILSISGDGEGVIRGEDQARYTFHNRDVRGFFAQPHDIVGFTPVESTATQLTLVKASSTSFAAGSASRPQKTEGPVSPWGYFLRCMNKYVDGNGRAARREYWWFVLFRWLLIAPIATIGFIIDAAMNPYGEVNPLGAVFMVVAGLIYLATALPNLCVLIRRLHDVGLSGWLVLINAIPYVGGLALFVISVLPSQKTRNTHGPVPGQAQQNLAEAFT